MKPRQVISVWFKHEARFRAHDPQVASLDLCVLLEASDVDGVEITLA